MDFRLYVPGVTGSRLYKATHPLTDSNLVGCIVLHGIVFWVTIKKAFDTEGAKLGHSESDMGELIP